MLNTCPKCCKAFKHEGFAAFPELKNIWKKLPNPFTCENTHDCPYELERTLQASPSKIFTLAALYFIIIVSKLKLPNRVAAFIFVLAIGFMAAVLISFLPILEQELQFVSATSLIVAAVLCLYIVLCHEIDI
jgi:hypothetical protein